jgi:RNA polymerase sigma-70 factor, ECF subfamily
MTESDLNIVRSLRQNDETALKLIFKIYFNQLFHFASEFVINKEIAREIVHDAVFRFWQHRSNLREDTHVKAYLLKIVRNLCLNYLAKVKNSTNLLISSEDLKQEYALNYEVLSTPDWDQLLVLEMEEILLQTISALPEKCRTVFELSRYKQLSNLEIANQLGISVKTVEGHMTEALKTIRLKLSKYLNILLFIFIYSFSLIFLF